jgi:hypothetical protein
MWWCRYYVSVVFVEELCVCFEVRLELKLALGSLCRHHSGGRGSGRQSDFLNLAVEEITLAHNASTLLDAPYLASSSSSFYRLRLLMPLLLLLCVRVRTRTGGIYEMQLANGNFSVPGSVLLVDCITGSIHCDMFACGYEINRESQRRFCWDVCAIMNCDKTRQTSRKTSKDIYKESRKEIWKDLGKF